MSVDQPDSITAVLFPGQGTQYPGMGVPWKATPSWGMTECASDVMKIDVAHLLVDADARELENVHAAQAAIATTALMALDALRREGFQPSIVVGHSLGELVALVGAGVLTADDLWHLVDARGRAMADASLRAPGTMCAVLGLHPEAVATISETIDDDVWVANDNSPVQAVIAGRPGPVRELAEACRANGARRVLPLAVSGAFHTPLMSSAQEQFAAAVRAVDFRPCSAAFASTVDASLHRSARGIDALLVRQLTAPVRWREAIGRVHAGGVRRFMELPPGHVLGGLVRANADGVEVARVKGPEDVCRVTGWAMSAHPPVMCAGALK